MDKPLTRFESLIFWSALSVASLGVIPLYFLIARLLIYLARQSGYPRPLTRRQ